jgi:hypothetical protein
MAIGTGIGVPFGVKFSWSSYWATRFPDTLTITPISDTHVTWDWVNHGVADYDDIRLERGTDGINYTEIDDVALGTTTYADGGMTPQTYYFRLRYKKGGSYSAYSNVVQITDATFYSAIGARVTTTGAVRITTDGKYRIVA